MGSAFGAALGAAGEQVHQQNLLNWQASYHANQAMADTLQHLAEQAKPEFAPKLLQAAFTYRTLPPGKKPPKDLDIHSLMVNHAVEQLQGQAPPAQAGGAPATAPTAAPQGQPSAPAGSATPADLAAPPSQGGSKDRIDPQDAVDIATQQELARVQQQQQVQQGVQQQGIVASAPPPLSGMPSPGMTSLTAPPALMPPPSFSDEHGPGQYALYTPQEHMMMAATGEALKANAIEAAKHEAVQRYGKQAIDTAEKLGIPLTPQQKGEIMTGMRLGKSYIPIPGVGMFDQATGEVIEAAKPTVVPAGASLVAPTSGKVIAQGQPLIAGQDIVEAPTETGYAKIQHDKTGKTTGFLKGPNGEIAAVPPPPGLVPRMHEVPVQTTDKQGNIVTTMQPAMSTPMLPGKGGLAKPPGGGRVIGISPQQTTKQWENPLTPNAQKVVEDTAPTLQMIDRAIAMLEPYKSDNTPFSHTLERLGYQFGLATDGSALINNLELNKVAGAARVLKGGSRAYPALQLAMQHLPNVSRGSNKLMYEQLQGVRQNVIDTINAAKSEGQKYPGMPRPEGQPEQVKPLAAPPNSVPTVSTQAEFDKLPKGAIYLEDGKKYRKP